MKNHAASSSDLEQAKRLSQRLTRREGPRAMRRASPSAYLRLQRLGDAKPLAPQAEPPPPEPQAEPPPRRRSTTPPPDIDAWEPMIKWCLAQFDADSGFAVDTQGFVIATAGKAAHDGFEGMGAELCYATEQLERIDPSAGALHWIDLEFGRRRVVCLRAAPEKKEPVLLAFIGVSADYGSIRSQIEHIVLDAMRSWG